MDHVRIEIGRIACDAEGAILVRDRDEVRAIFASAAASDREGVLGAKRDDLVRELHFAVGVIPSRRESHAFRSASPPAVCER